MKLKAEKENVYSIGLKFHGKVKELLKWIFAYLKNYCKIQNFFQFFFRLNKFELFPTHENFRQEIITARNTVNLQLKKRVSTFESTKLIIVT